ncbi:hypothetical protein ACFL14_01215 [Patescibacteria group bacterium]
MPDVKEEVFPDKDTILPKLKDWEDMTEEQLEEALKKTPEPFQQWVAAQVTRTSWPISRILTKLIKWEELVYHPDDPKSWY